jgi:hypothetical protein
MRCNPKPANPVQSDVKMTKRRRAAPDPEWVQMYRQGIPSPKIAAYSGAAESTVRYHLHVAAREDPGLRDAHKTAVGRSIRRTSAGLRNLNDTVAFYETEGRFPTTGGKTARERSLGVWLHRRRQDAAAGTLLPAYREILDTLPGWRQLSTRQVDNDARWTQRLGELEDYLSAGHGWPRHKATDTEQERVLGVWLHVQRICRRQKTLSALRVAQLDAVAPGWIAGRVKPLKKARKA